ncbi:hypothetical protein OC834_004673 [Tilletia horrida]|nr:hypothetical protein OC834_004673 [Tilletia horrida]
MEPASSSTTIPASSSTPTPPEALDSHGASPRAMLPDTDTNAPIPLSPLSFASGDAASEQLYAPDKRYEERYEDDDDEEEEYTGYTGQHASIVTATAILSRCGAVFPTPVQYPACSPPSSLSYTRSKRSRAESSSRLTPGSSRRNSLDDFALPGGMQEGPNAGAELALDEGGARAEEEERRFSASSHSHSTVASSLGLDDIPSVSSSLAIPQSTNSTSARINNLARSWSPRLHAAGSSSASSTWLPPLELGGQIPSSSRRGSSSGSADPALLHRFSASPPNDKPDTPTQHTASRASARPPLPQRQATAPFPFTRPRPRPRQRASNGSALEALGALLLHSREAKGRPSVLSFARLSSAEKEKKERGPDTDGTSDEEEEEEDALTFQRGSDDERDDELFVQTSSGSRASEHAGTTKSTGNRSRAGSASGSGARTPQYHAPSSFLFGNHKPARPGSVRSTRSSSLSFTQDESSRPMGGGGAQAPPRRTDSMRSSETGSSLFNPDDRSLWLRRFFGPPHSTEQQSLNLPFGLKFPTMQASSLLTAKGRSTTLTIAERRARRFLLGPMADESRTEDPAFRLVWTRRNQPSFQVERKSADETMRPSSQRPQKLSGRVQSTSPGPSRQTSVDDSMISPILRSPPFRRTRSEMPAPSAPSNVPRPTFPYACDEPIPSLTAASLLRRRRRKYGHDADGFGHARPNEGEEGDSPPAVSLAGILGPSSMPDLPEPPPSPLAMPGAWVGSSSYHRSGRRAWLWWEGKGDESPSVSFDYSPRGARFSSAGDRAMSRNLSSGSVGSASGAAAAAAGVPGPGKRGLLSLPLLAGRSSSSTKTATMGNSSSSARKRRRAPQHHLYEEGALWLPPPLLDDAGSSAASFEGLLGIKRMREQEEARKQLERLRARNRPTHKPGLITALGNFVKAAHAAEVSQKRLRKEHEREAVAAAVAAGGRRRMMMWKRPGVGALGSSLRSLSAFELGRGARGAGLASADDVQPGGEGADEVAAAEEDAGPDAEDDDEEETPDDEEEDDRPGTRLWWDRLFSGAGAATSGSAWADLSRAGWTRGAHALGALRPAPLPSGGQQKVASRPEMVDRSFTEPVLLQSSDGGAETPLSGPGASLSHQQQLLESSAAPPSSASSSRRMLNGSAGPASASGSVVAFASHALSTLNEDQRTDFSAEFATSASSPRLRLGGEDGGALPSLAELSALDSSASGSSGSKHVLFSTPLESPRLRGSASPALSPSSSLASTSASTSASGPKRKSNMSTVPASRQTDSRTGSPLRELPHAPRLVPIHISNPASPMTPLVSDASDPFFAIGSGGAGFGRDGRRRSGSSSAGTLSPLVRSWTLASSSQPQPPSSSSSLSASSSLSDLALAASGAPPRAPRLNPTQMSLPPSPWTENGRVVMTPVESTPKKRSFFFEGAEGGAANNRSLTASPVARPASIREGDEQETAAAMLAMAGRSPRQNGNGLGLVPSQQQFSFRLSAELVRPDPTEAGLRSISPRLVPTKLEIIASPMLRATSEGAEQFDQQQHQRGLGLMSPALTPLKEADDEPSRRDNEMRSGSGMHARRAVGEDAPSAAASMEERLTPTALFMSKPAMTERKPSHAASASSFDRPARPASILAGSRSASQRQHPTRRVSSTSPATFRQQQHKEMPRAPPRSQRSFFLWLLIGDLFLGTDPSIAAKAMDPSKTPPGTVEMGPIAGVLSHLIGFVVFTLAHVLDLATNAWENAMMAAWFLRWLFLNVTGQTVLSRCIYEVFQLVRDEWKTVALEDHEDRASRRKRRRRRGSWSAGAAAGAGEDEGGEDEDEDGGDDARDESGSFFGRELRAEPKGLSKWQILRGLTELACLQAVTRERYLAEGAGLEKLRGWRKRRRSRRGWGKASRAEGDGGANGHAGGGGVDPAAYSNSSTITELSLDGRYASSSSSSCSSSDDDEESANRHVSNDGSPTSASASASASISSDEDESDESDEEMIVTRQDADVLEFAKTPRATHPPSAPSARKSGSGSGRPAYATRQSSAGASASSYFGPAAVAAGEAAGSSGSGSGSGSSGRPASARITPAAMFGMTPLHHGTSSAGGPGAEAGGVIAADATPGTVLPPAPSAEEDEEEAAAEGGQAAGRSKGKRRGSRARRGSLLDQTRVHGALWSDSARDLVKTIKWASRMAISAYGLHVHIVDLPPTFTPSGKRFNRQTFAHLSRLNPDDVLHAEIQTLDSEAAYQPTFYIVRDFVRKVIVVSVRGTQSFSDIIVDLDINVETVALPALKNKDRSGEAQETETETEWVRDPQLKAHAGIWRAAQSLIQPGSTLFDTLKAAMEELGDGFGVVFTGHSLGAAIASAVALLISELKPLEEERVEAAASSSSSSSYFKRPAGSGSGARERGIWLTRPGTGLPPGRPIRTIAFANPATVSAALADRAGLGIVPLVTTVVLGSDVIPRAGHGQARELRRVLGALSRVRRRTAFADAGGKGEEEDARVHIVRSWWDWRSICAAATEAAEAVKQDEEPQEGAQDQDEDEDERVSKTKRKKQKQRQTAARAKQKKKKLSVAGLDAFALDRKERIEDQLWKLRCDVEADLYAAVKARMGDGAAAAAGLRTPGLSPWIGPGGGAQHPLHKLATRRQKLDLATLASEAREEERAEGGRVMLLPAGQSLLVEGGEIYVVGSPLGFFSLPELTPKMLADHLPSAYEAALEEDLVL